jgi:hypothetical protein
MRILEHGPVAEVVISFICPEHFQCNPHSLTIVTLCFIFRDRSVVRKTEGQQKSIKMQQVVGTLMLDIVKRVAAAHAILEHACSRTPVKRAGICQSTKKWFVAFNSVHETLDPFI